MARKSNAAIAAQSTVVNTALTAENAPELTADMQAMVGRIDALFGEAQVASVTAFWRIGQNINLITQNPENYLTAEQVAAEVDPVALLISMFSTIYSVEQLRAAEAFYEKYPTERELNRLVALRSPERPSWRMTTSHIQLLTQIADDDQRAAIEEKCVDEALTAKSLAGELQELRGGKTSKGGRSHQAPKGIKNQLHDLLQNFRRLIGRSESLWLGDENIYDDFVNTSPTKREGVAQEHWDELGDVLTKMSDCIGDHIAMYNRATEAIQGGEEAAAEEEDDALVADAKRAAAAAAAARRNSKLTR